MKTQTDQELMKMLTDTRAHLRTERFAKAGARAKDSNAAGKFRREIARVLTEQHARRTSAAASVSPSSRSATA